jgi:hypothetical protein
MTVRVSRMSRKARFRAALGLAGTTETAWADANKVTRQHLYLVLKGERTSAPLIAKIEAFIGQQLGKEATAYVA